MGLRVLEQRHKCRIEDRSQERQNLYERSSANTFSKIFMNKPYREGECQLPQNRLRLPFFQLVVQVTRG